MTMKQITLGTSVKEKEIYGYFFGDENAFNKTLIIGGIHGNEPQSTEICELYLKDVKDKPFLEDAFLLLIPCLNPDGMELKTRGNANSVDLNRNFPTNTWQGITHKGNSAYFPGKNPVSEPETKIIVELFSKHNFKKLISIHTNAVVQYKNPPMINYDGEQSRELAEKLSTITGLMAHSDIGYATPGSLGTWIGLDLKKISITVELDHTKSAKGLYKKHGKLFEMCVLSL